MLDEKIKNTKIDEKALFLLSQGIYVVGSYDENGGLVGLLADAVLQVSFNPFYIILSCDEISYTGKCIKVAKEFSVSILSDKASPKLLADFGFSSSKETNKWVGLDFDMKGKLPVLKECLAVITAKVESYQKVGRSTLFIAEVVEAVVSNHSSGVPMTYLEYRNKLKDKVNALIHPSVKKGEKKWVCTICGYVYDDSIPFESLPETWVCPVCCVGKDCFELKEI